MDLFTPAEAWPHLRSSQTLRFSAVDAQEVDGACGFAALAALLRLYRGLTADQSTLVDEASARRGGEAVPASLAVLANLARSRGLEVAAFRAPWSALPGLLVGSAPLLVHYDRPRPHFALLLACGDRGAVVADPARGLELLSRGAFEARWSGVVALVGVGDGGAPLAEAVGRAHARSRLIDRALADRRALR